MSVQMSTLGKMESRGTEGNSSAEGTWGEGSSAQSLPGVRGGLSGQSGGTLSRLESRGTVRDSSTEGMGGESDSALSLFGRRESLASKGKYYGGHREWDRFESDCT